jgi:PAS domain S-box-containing protein
MASGKMKSSRRHKDAAEERDMVQRKPTTAGGLPVLAIGTTASVGGEPPNLLENLVEYANAPIIIWDAEFRISLFNHAFEPLTGRTAAEVIGGNLDILFPEDGRENSMERIRRATAGQRMEVEEIPIRHRDGSIRTVLWNSTTLYDGKRPVATIAQGQDITERKKAEEELRRHRDHLEELVAASTRDLRGANEILRAEIVERRRAELAAATEGQRFYDVLEMLPVYVALLSLDYHVPFANRFFRDRFGESHGKRCFEYLFGRTEPCEVCGTYSVLRTKRPHRWEWLGPDGRDYDIFDFPFTDSRGATLIMEVGIDITDQKQAQQALVQARDELETRVQQRTAELTAANRELEAFSYSVSHDLRAPLRSIDGFSLALLEDHADQLDDQGRDYLHRVRAASQTMGQLIDNLLDLSKVTRTEIHRGRVDLSGLAHSIAQELRAGEPKRQVDFCITPGLSGYGDGPLLRTALENLMGNSWKFTGKSESPRIEFGAIKEGCHDVFFVRDNGVGFDMNHAGRLFDPFRRLHSNSEFPGTGIGLATVRRIFDRHGGHVWANSETGKGATFYFTMGQPPEA